MADTVAVKDGVLQCVSSDALPALHIVRKTEEAPGTWERSAGSAPRMASSLASISDTSLRTVL